MPIRPSDETSSNASFEDIADNKHAVGLAVGPTVNKVGSQGFQDGEIPDVLYVVHFRDAEGKVVESKLSFSFRGLGA